MAAKTWMIRNLDKDTKKIIRMYAIERSITTAEALAAIVAEWKAKK